MHRLPAGFLASKNGGLVVVGAVKSLWTKHQLTHSAGTSNHHNVYKPTGFYLVFAQHIHRLFHWPVTKFLSVNMYFSPLYTVPITSNSKFYEYINY